MENIDFDINTDFDEDTDQVYNEDIRLFDLNKNLSEDLLIINIKDAFNSCDTNGNSNTNYMELLLDNYVHAKNNKSFEFDAEIINGIVFRIASVFLGNLNDKFNVTLGNNHEDGNISNIEEYLEKLIALYEFFICKRRENITEYLIRKIFKNKTELFEIYKNRLTSKDSADLFYSVNKKKYSSSADAAFLYFIDDIITDIIDESQDAYILFKTIVNMDIYEVTNNKIYEMLENNGFDISYPLGVHEAAKKYFSLINNKETYVEIRNSIYLYYTENTEINNSNSMVFNKHNDFADSMLNHEQKQFTQIKSNTSSIGEE